MASTASITSSMMQNNMPPVIRHTAACHIMGTAPTITAHTITMGEAERA